MEVALGGEAVEDEAGGGDEADGEEHPEAHFGFADGVVAGGEPGGYAVGGRGERYSEGVADDVA